MALIGIAYNDSFAHVRAAVPGSEDLLEDLTCPYYIANWFGPTLAQAGHHIEFLVSNQAVNERQLRATSLGGQDDQFADRVDLYLIITHGNYSTNHHEAILTYDTKVDSFTGESKNCRLGDNCNLDWLLIYGCKTIDRDHVEEHLPMFSGLHLLCGAWDVMYDSWTIDEVGEDTALNLISGMTVCEAWSDGVSDWFVNNHPMVISVESEATYNNGNPDWGSMVIGSDHLWGHGVTREDVLPPHQWYMAYKWWD